MKKQLLFLFLMLGLAFGVNAQISVNLGLDSWQSVNGYEEPTNGWSTLNELKNLLPFGAGPVTVTKTTDAHSGAYAAKLTTDQISGVNTLIGGLLATGYFDNNASPGQNLKLGVPYNTSPKYFSGYYKYTSVSGDSADFFCALTKWNSTLNRRDTLGTAAYREYNTVSNYTQFNFEIDYTDSVTVPDTIVMLFSSSGGAQNFQGQVGSTLYVDEITLTNTSGVAELLSNEVEVELFPNPTNDYLNINVLEDVKGLSYSIYNYEGKLVTKNKLNKNTKIDVSLFKEGKYFISIMDTKGLVASKNFIIVK